MTLIVLLLRISPIWLFFGLTAGWLHGRTTKRGPGLGFVRTWALASAATGAGCMLISELAGAFNQLTPMTCAAAWILADACVLALLLKEAGNGFRNWTASGLAGRVKCQSWLATLLLGASVFFLLTLALLAIETPTTVWDAHTFHMPRIMHWLQDHNLNSYPTNIARQIEYAPGTEMAIAQLMLLAGTDLPANLPQWWALATCSLLAGSMARGLLAAEPLRQGVVSPRRVEIGAVLAVFLCATFPDAACQALSSVCDLYAAMWVMMAVVFGWEILREPGRASNYVGCGAALALALAAKPTAILYICPFGLLLAIGLVRKRSFAPLLWLGATALLLTLVLNGPWMMRNYALVRNPLGPRSTFTANTVTVPITPAKVAVNVLRNVSLYTRTPSQWLTSTMNTTLATAMVLCDEPLDDPAWTYGNLGFQFQEKSSLADGSGLGNCYLGLLLVIALAMFLVRFKLRSASGLYILAVGVSFVLFSAYLKFDPWHGRLLIPYFLLAAPFIAVVMGSSFKPWVTALLAGFLLVNAVLAVTCNPTYPTLAAVFHTRPREALYFAVRPELREPTLALADDLVQTGCTHVLLKTGADTWEYPLWALLKARGFQGTIEHTLVENESALLTQHFRELPHTVLLVAEARNAAVPKEFALQVSYGDWRAFYRASAPEERARMIQNQAVLKYTFAQAGVLQVSFEPRSAAGELATNGTVGLIIRNIETNTFQNVSVVTTNIPLTPITRFSCAVVAPSVTVVVTNWTPANPIAYLFNLDAAQQVKR